MLDMLAAGQARDVPTLHCSTRCIEGRRHRLSATLRTGEVQRPIWRHYIPASARTAPSSAPARLAAFLCRLSSFGEHPPTLSPCLRLVSELCLAT